MLDRLPDWRPRCRRLLLFVAFGLALLVTRPSSAGVARAIALADLVRGSDLVAVGTPVESYSVWEKVGTRARIVTYSRVQVEETISGPGTESEVLVRTLGGHVGTIGQIVHGEAMIALGQRAMLFVHHAADGTVSFTARSQGYFPLRADSTGTVRLAAPNDTPHLLGNVARSALAELVGLTPADAARHVLAVTHP